LVLQEMSAYPKNAIPDRRPENTDDSYKRPFPELPGSTARESPRPFHDRFHPIHPVNLSLDHGSVIQEVSGSGSSRASDTASHPSGNAIERVMPLRDTQRSSPRASQT
jgi:hypothetical protein